MIIRSAFEGNTHAFNADRSFRIQQGAIIKHSATSRKGRKCQRRSCKNVLSVYNHDLYCHSCSIQQPTTRIGSARKAPR